MANHKNALKKHKQNVQARLRNRLHKSRMRTALQKLRKALADGDVATAKTLIGPTLSIVDRTAKHGVIHDNAAARTKSRLTLALQRAEAS